MFDRVLESYLQLEGKASAIVDFNKQSDKLYEFDLTENNQELTEDIISNTAVFSAWISKKLSENYCRYGIGGYNEHRTIYRRSHHFDDGEESRRLHLGVDIWGPVGTKVYAPIVGKVHSYRFNNNFGDYGATIILEHSVGQLKFHSLYGHLSLNSIKNISEGDLIIAGEEFAEFGDLDENGGWPPHLHFQLIKDLYTNQGDFPGVCRFSEREKYLENCPDPKIILNYTFK